MREKRERERGVWGSESEMDAAVDRRDGNDGTAAYNRSNFI